MTPEIILMCMICSVLGFCAGVIIEWFCFIMRIQKLKLRIKQLNLVIAKNSLVGAITKPIAKAFAEEVCKTIFGRKK